MSDIMGPRGSEPRPHSESVRIEVHPFEDETSAAARLASDLVSHYAVRAHLTGSDLKLATFELLDKDAGDQARFEAIIHDPADCRRVRLQGTVAQVQQATAHPLPDRQRPSEEDFQRAVESILNHHELRSLIESSGTQAYQPMPPYLDIQSPDGTVARMVTVGIRAEQGDIRHRIVGVLPNGSVVLNPEGVPHPTAANCEPPAPQGGCSSVGGRDQVRVRFSRAIWRFGTSSWCVRVPRQAPTDQESSCALWTIKARESFIGPTSLSSTWSTARLERPLVAGQPIETGKTRKAASTQLVLSLSVRASESARRRLRPFSKAA